MSELYSKNLKFFEKRANNIYYILTNAKATYPIALEKANSDVLNYVVEYNNVRCFVNSIYDIQNEVESIFSNVDKDVETLILFGFGCGHYIEYIDKNYPHLKKLIIVEPLLDLFKQTLEYIDIEKTIRPLMNRNVCITFFVNETDQQASASIYFNVAEFLTLKMGLAFHVSYRTLLNGYFEKICSKLLNEIRNIRLNSATSIAYAKLFLNNAINNWKKINYIPAERFFSEFKGLPAIVVSAGPSLEKHIDLLREVNHRALIVSVGSASRILDYHGIVPHFRCAVDPHSNNEKIYNNIDTSTAPIFYSDRFYHKSLYEYKAPKVKMITEVDWISQYIYKLMKYKDYMVVPSGFSVANIALNLLCVAGCSKVILVGQDLCFTSNKVYAKGSHMDDFQLTVDKQNIVKAENIKGEEVYTKKQYLAMKQVFEQIAERYSEIEFINATEGGLNIQHFKNMNFHDVLKELPKGLDVSKIIKNVFDNVGDGFYRKQQMKLDEVLGCLGEQLAEVKKVYEHYSGRLKKLSKYVVKQSVGVNKTLFELITFNNEFDNEMEKLELYQGLINKELGIQFQYLRLINRGMYDSKKKQLEDVHTMLTLKLKIIGDYLSVFEDLLNNHEDNAQTEPIYTKY